MRKLTKSEQATADALGEAALFHVTPTFFSRSNPDCNKAMRDLLRRNKVLDYDSLKLGGENKVMISGFYQDGSEVKISCYRTRTRGDKRIWFNGLKAYANAGDIMALVVRRGKLVLQNVTQGAVAIVFVLPALDTISLPL